MIRHRKNQLKYKRESRIKGKPTNVGDPLVGFKPKKKKEDA